MPVRHIRRALRPLRTRFDRLVTSPRFLEYLAQTMQRLVPGNDAHDIFARHGFHLLRHHYYLPIPEQAELRFARESELHGVTIDPETCFRFLETAIVPYQKEFQEFPLHKETEDGYHVVNGTFMAIDGHAYYGVIRHFAPRKIIEIGSGNSTRLAAAAIRRNLSDGKPASELVCIEPFHAESLRRLPEVSSVVESLVQEVDLSEFTSLRRGDVLFIDSTHTVRPGGDVWWEFCEILPRLSPGVLVHVHDISLPRPYPATSIDNHWYWMEQYLLQAFLTFNSKFRVLWPGNFLMCRYPDRMRNTFRREYDAMRSVYANAEPASFWMEAGESG